MNHFEINVSLDGHHLFATAERSIRDILALKRVLPLIQERFPAKDGFVITVSDVRTVGKPQSERQLKKLLSPS